MATTGDQDAGGPGRGVARTLGFGFFAFGSLVSAVVLYTAERLAAVDVLLIVGAPLALGALAYFVGLHHDPDAPD